MANICSRYSVRGCPASQYLTCNAYATGRNCWEVADKPCCKIADKQRCAVCSVFSKGLAELAVAQNDVRAT